MARLGLACAFNMCLALSSSGNISSTPVSSIPCKANSYGFRRSPNHGTYDESPTMLDLRFILGAGEQEHLGVHNAIYPTVPLPVGCDHEHTETVNTCR